MKFSIPKDKIRYNTRVMMNRLGYHQHLDRQARQASFIKRLGGLHYPRFHVYLSEDSDAVNFNIHLDEKKPSYGSTPRHSGQYEGDLVEQEAQRIITNLLAYG